MTNTPTFLDSTWDNIGIGGDGEMLANANRGIPSVTSSSRVSDSVASMSAANL